MAASWSDVLSTGMGLKIDQVKQATQTYVRDRTNQATGTAASYAVAAGLFATAGVFAAVVVFVGLIALYRWVGFKYGMFWGLGAVGGLMLLIAVVFAIVAVSRLNRKPSHLPSLTSRLRVAITANPHQGGPIDVLRDHTGALMSDNAIANSHRMSRSKLLSQLVKNRSAQTGLIVGASILSWALMRRKTKSGA